MIVFFGDAIASLLEVSFLCVLLVVRVRLPAPPSCFLAKITHPFVRVTGAKGRLIET